MDLLVAMRSFVRTVENASFAAAAAAGSLSPTMVGNHIRYLEARLGTPLLHRSTRRQGVTEFGRSYYDRCRSILLEVDAADASAGAMLAAPRCLLRVTAPLAIGMSVLPRIVATYLERHREVHVDLVLGDHRLDLLANGLDVASRAGTLPDSGLVARALPPIRLVLCASPATSPRTAPCARPPTSSRTSASTSSTTRRICGASRGRMATASCRCRGGFGSTMARRCASPLWKASAS